MFAAGQMVKWTSPTTNNEYVGEVTELCSLKKGHTERYRVKGEQIDCYLVITELTIS